jgi:hypothetical protein
MSMNHVYEVFSLYFCGCNFFIDVDFLNLSSHHLVVCDYKAIY